MTYSQFAEIAVPVLMRAYEAVHICWGESKVDRKPSPSELVRFPREGDFTGRVRQLFAMVLEGIYILSAYSEKPRDRQVGVM